VTAPWAPGTTCLVVPVPEAEPVVGPWRATLDPSAAWGVPPHVSVMYPFLDVDVVDRPALAALFAGHAAFDAGFGRCLEDDGLLYLEPSPGGPFALLTEAVTGRWPDAVPYGGKYGPVLPHLSVGYGGDGSGFGPALAAISRGLPVSTRVTAVELVVFDGTTWTGETSFPLLGQDV
jgi:hypothetical protein